MVPRSTVVVVLLLVVGVLGCASARNERIDHYRIRLDPLLATGTRDDVMREFGNPTTRTQLGEIEAWVYLSRGLEHERDAPGSDSLESVEKLTLTFDRSGTLLSWQLEDREGVLYHEQVFPLLGGVYGPDSPLQPDDPAPAKEK